MVVGSLQFWVVSMKRIVIKKFVMVSEEVLEILNKTLMVTEELSKIL